MFCEVEETVNFLALHMYNHIPRRKVCLFAESLANFLLFKFQSSWDQTDPTKGSKGRELHVKVKGVSDPLLSTAAEAVGIQLDEILGVLPFDMTICVNPGEVTVVCGGKSTVIYSATQKSSSTLNKLMPAESGGQPHGTHLRLNLNTPAGSNWLVADGEKGTIPMFELATPHDVKFTVGSFAMTRFGTTKLKTDMMQLQHIQRNALTHYTVPSKEGHSTPSVSPVTSATPSPASSATSFSPVYHPSALFNRPLFVPPTANNIPNHIRNMPIMH